jgi:hypothetical protein
MLVLHKVLPNESELTQNCRVAGTPVHGKPSFQTFTKHLLMSSYPTEKPLSPRFLNGTIAKGNNPRATLGALSRSLSRFAADLLYQVSIIDGTTIQYRARSTVSIATAEK